MAGWAHLKGPYVAAVINASAGESKTLSATVSVSDSTDISADTFAVALGSSYWTPPTDAGGWQPPEPAVIDAQHVRAGALLNPPPGYYWRWIRVNDTGGDLAFIRVPGRIELR
jgi:hypothetical protein